MSTVDDILSERDCGFVRCGVSQSGQTDVLALATEFGLKDDCAAYAPIAASEASRLVASILHKDMAYREPIMTLERASQLAEQFLAGFGSDAKFFSNGWPDGWNPATDATFDTGVLIIGNDRSGCIWVEDED